MPRLQTKTLFLLRLFATNNNLKCSSLSCISFLAKAEHILERFPKEENFIRQTIQTGNLTPQASYFSLETIRNLVRIQTIQAKLHKCALISFLPLSANLKTKSA